MDVGVNYPWHDYGWDFGTPPQTWRQAGANPRWTTVVDLDLKRLRQLGIKLVRWFILADGLTYGSGSDAPTQDSDSRWHFDPPALDPELGRHFGMLLDRFDAANAGQETRIQLMPVLIDFHFCEAGKWAVGIPDEAGGQTLPDPDWVKQGRADAIADPKKRTVFLQEVLAPLLQVAASTAARRAVVHSWDIINEPEWVTNGWHPDPSAKGLPVNEADMRAFIEEAKKTIRAQQFLPTVGWARFATIKRSGIALDVLQPHHYADGSRPLQPVPAGPTVQQYILGEFATNTARDIWPELRSTQSVLARLQHAQKLNYHVAMAWSMRQPDHHSDWGAGTESDIECFVFGRGCPKNP